MLTAVPEPSFLATRRGKLTLLLLCGIAFLDFVDASITNVALPSISADGGSFSVHWRGTNRRRRQHSRRIEVSSFSRSQRE